MKKYQALIVFLQFFWALGVAYATLRYTSPIREPFEYDNNVVEIFTYLVIIPLVLAAVTLIISEILRKEAPAQFFHATLIGMEIGMFFIGSSVLIRWYIVPEDSRSEPLFVAVGIVFIAIEATRRAYNSLTEMFEKIRDSK